MIKTRPAPAPAATPTAGRCRPPRRGVAMLELAIVLPIFLMLVLGIIEMGRVMMIGQMATNACREGCRQAIVPGADTAAILETVDKYLNAAGVSETGRDVKMLNGDGQESDLNSIGSHEPVTIRITLPYAENTWGFSAIMGSKTLVAESTMRRE